MSRPGGLMMPLGKGLLKLKVAPPGHAGVPTPVAGFMQGLFPPSTLVSHGVPMLLTPSRLGVSSNSTALEIQNKPYPPRITVLGFHWYANPRCGENCFQGLSCA